MTAAATTMAVDQAIGPSVADLEVRAGRAYEIARQAEADGNDDLLRRAMQRLYLRRVQIAYLEERPAEIWCPMCVWGMDSWPADDLINDDPPVWLCFDHAAGDHAQQVAALMADWDEGAPACPSAS